MITQVNVAKITAELNRVFPGAPVKCKEKLANDGFETISCQVDEDITMPQLHSLHYLVSGIPNSFKMKRAGMGIKLLFS